MAEAVVRNRHRWARVDWPLMLLACAGIAYLATHRTGWFGEPMVAFVRGGHDSHSLEEDIRCAREMMQALAPRIHATCEIIELQQAQFEQLRRDLRAADAELLDLKHRLVSLRASLPLEHDSSDGRLRRHELQQMFDAYRSREAALRWKHEVLRNREAELVRARAAQDEALRRRGDLESSVAEFELRLALLQGNARLQRAGKLDSAAESERLARLDELLRDIRRRLSITERVAHWSREGSVTRTDAEPANQEIEQEIDRYFSPGYGDRAAEGP